MKHSTDRILTTHTGSLPRPDDLVSMLEGHDQREARGEPRFAERVKSAVAEIVQKQAASGVDVVNDGEMSKVGYSTYVTERVTGFSDQWSCPCGAPPGDEKRSQVGIVTANGPRA
jgi:5-methyltetrahydropteroyltriglutamate--homocysteine methyltransferase